jgi:hypothetical protein
LGRKVSQTQGRFLASILGKQCLELGEGKNLWLKEIQLGEVKTWLWGRKHLQQKILNFLTNRTTSFQKFQACCLQD